jgi:hypothetical protein
MKSLSEIKWLRVLGFANNDGAYCLGCIDLDAIPEDESFTTIYGRDYPDGFTCVKCCDVIKGESNES